MKSPIWGIETSYRILGLKEGCSQKEAKRAYRKMSLQHHPDKSNEELAERKFILIRLAYEWVMFDLAKRHPKSKITKLRTQFGRFVSPYSELWEDILHSKEFENWDEKNPALSQELYKGAKGSGKVIKMGEMGYFDKQGFWHDHLYGKIPTVMLEKVIASYKEKKTVAKRKK